MSTDICSVVLTKNMLFFLSVTSKWLLSSPKVGEASRSQFIHVGS